MIAVVMARTVRLKLHFKSSSEVRNYGTFDRRGRRAGRHRDQSALRFYEKEGLIHSERSEGGQRRYHRDVLRLVAFIRAAQRVGLTLDEIRDALATLPEGRRRPRPTGRACRRAGGRCSTDASRKCSASATASTAASVAGACRSRRARCRTPTTSPRPTGRARVGSWYPIDARHALAWERCQI